MNEHDLSASVAYCGLVCGLCRSDGGCTCKSGNHCGKRLSPEGCYQYRCCTEKGLNGCWECPQSPCGIDMLAPEKVKLRAFVRFIKEAGLEKFAHALAANERCGVVYHRKGIYGDYDLETEESVLNLLKSAE